MLIQCTLKIKCQGKFATSILIGTSKEIFQHQYIAFLRSRSGLALEKAQNLILAN